MTTLSCELRTSSGRNGEFVCVKMVRSTTVLWGWYNSSGGGVYCKGEVMIVNALWREEDDEVGSKIDSQWWRSFLFLLSSVCNVPPWYLLSILLCKKTKMCIYILCASVAWRYILIIQLVTWVVSNKMINKNPFSFYWLLLLLFKLKSMSKVAVAWRVSGPKVWIKSTRCLWFFFKMENLFYWVGHVSLLYWKNERYFIFISLY